MQFELSVYENKNNLLEDLIDEILGLPIFVIIKSPSYDFHYYRK